MAVHSQLTADRNRTRAVTIIIELILKNIAAIGDGGQHLPHQAFSVFKQRKAIAFRFCQAVAVHHFPQTPLTNPIGGNLGVEVPFPFHRSAHIGQQHRQQVAVELAGTDNFDRRNTQPFLKDFRGQRQGTGAHAANVGMMGTVGKKKGRLLLARKKDRRNQGDIRQVGAAPVGIVEQHHIPRSQIAPL